MAGLYGWCTGRVEMGQVHCITVSKSCLDLNPDGDSSF